MKRSLLGRKKGSLSPFWGKTIYCSVNFKYVLYNFFTINHKPSYKKIVHINNLDSFPDISKPNIFTLFARSRQAISATFIQNLDQSIKNWQRFLRGTDRANTGTKFSLEK